MTALTRTISCDDPKLILAPYVWRQTGHGDSARAQATMPGAYLRASFTGSATLAILIDSACNAGCKPRSMPTVEWSVDHGPFQTLQLTRTDEVYPLPLAQNLTIDQPHHLEFHFRSANLVENRWVAPTANLRLAGLTLESAGALLDHPRRKKLAIGYGDSITEGVGAEGLFVSWDIPEPNNARITWLPLLASALDCEYGQLGTGGMGMACTNHLPPLSHTWDRYDQDHSRLQDGLLLPEPDYVLCNLGTNDLGLVITDAYIQWLAVARQACPQAQFFCIVPLLGLHRAEISAAVATRQSTGDARVHLIDVPSLQSGFGMGPHATALADDGVHPTAHGQALFAAHLAVEIQKILDSASKA